MERSEKALAPEWLKVANGAASSGGGSAPHHSASSSQPDHLVNALPARRRSSSVSSCDHETSHSSIVDRISSSYFRRSSSSNGAMMHDKDLSMQSQSYGSFMRSYRERGWDKDIDIRLGQRDGSDPLTLASRSEKDTLRRSQSMISGKRGEVWSRRIGNEASNGLTFGGSVMNNIHKAAFERDFPSLGAEEKLGVPDIGRVSSPGLSSAVLSLSIGASAVIGGEGWTSALAELPVAVGGNSTIPSIQQAAPVSSASVAPSTSTGLNMAETLAQTPARPRNTPQLSVENQRFEELAIKQSRQLIPMTPSMPKTLVLNLTEKPKSKTVKSSDSSSVAKAGHQHSSSQLVNQTVRGASRSDILKPSQAGKLTVLKATREMNDASPTAKDGLSPTNATRVRFGVTQQAANKVASFPLAQNSMDKRYLSQAQNRIDFFNSLRKKTSENHSTSVTDSINEESSMTQKSSDQITAAGASICEEKSAPEPPPDSKLSLRDDNNVLSTVNACEGSEILSGDVDKDLSSDLVVLPDEEVAFLRSMGWEEHAGEEAAPLTEEEINAFYELLKLRQPSELPQGVQQSKIVPFQSHLGSLGGASSALTSSDSESEA